jgi:alpha-tubulin suppressor-like RCC1 family protein
VDQRKQLGDRPTSHGAALVLVASLASIGACRTHPPTQVLVFFHAEGELSQRAERLQVVVRGPRGELALDETEPVVMAAGGAVGRVPLVPQGGDARRTYRVVARLLGPGDEVLGRLEANAGYVAEELRELHLWFDEECRGGPDCEDGQTCVRGLCAGACFEPVLAGEVTRSEPQCGECESCVAAACAPRPDGSECGCPGTDECVAGDCLTSRPVSEVRGALTHTCAVVEADLWCWGSDRVGQLGNGPDAGSSASPVLIQDGAVSDAATGTEHTCMLNFEGQRECWGWNGAGQLGTGERVEAAFESPVDALEDDPAWARIDTGWYHNCGLTRDGRILCWGNNSRFAVAGDLGDVAVPEPTRVDHRVDYVAVTAGGFQGCGLRDDGRIYCWGWNGSGQLGFGDTENRERPFKTGCPAGEECIEDWAAVASGEFHVCAIRRNGELWCWGGGLNGQLGVGTLTERDSTRPLRVDLDGVAAVSAGRSHTCVIREDDSLWCWGNNELGQLGLGPGDNRFRPERVRLLEDDRWLRIRLGQEHTCAIRSDRTLWCWGRNDEGQLGLGFVSDEDDPIVATPKRVCFPPAG